MRIGGEKPGPWDETMEWNFVHIYKEWKMQMLQLHENTIVSYLHTLMLGEKWIEKSFTFESTYDYE